jgi:hypothetical protein
MSDSVVLLASTSTVDGNFLHDNDAFLQRWKSDIVAVSTFVVTKDTHIQEGLGLGLAHQYRVPIQPLAGSTTTAQCIPQIHKAFCYKLIQYQCFHSRCNCEEAHQ